MEAENCSVNLEVCLEEEKEVKKEGDVEVVLEDVMVHIGLEEEEVLETSPNQSPYKVTTEVKEETASNCIKKEETECGEEEEKEEEEKGEEEEEKVKVHHKTVQKKVSKLFPCKKCGLVSRSLASFKKHMMSHTSKKPYRCTYCLKAFKQRHYLLNHWRIHTGERPFKCEKCGQTLSSSSRLKYHRMIHTGERPYMCQQCGVPFREEVTLQAHMAVHLNVGPFACEECGQEFPRLAGLSLHRRVHANKDLYLYVHDKEASKIFSTALQKASCKVNPLNGKLAQESEKYLSSESVGE